MSVDEDDLSDFGGEYENGHWIWDDTAECLAFISDEPENVVAKSTYGMNKNTITGAKIRFKDDVDVIEQLRFRRRYQRKLNPGEKDVITVQDVKDIAIYTAPMSILSSLLIDVLHLPTTERFMRTLILYCQYYLQISEIMANRRAELERKIRTRDCDIIENQYRDNLSDLRLLVAKEYYTMVLGAGDTKKFHHMGSSKKKQSLSDRDSRLFETLLRMSTQIVWLALGRKSFNAIELEINRLFKTEIFNAVEHMIRSNYIEKMSVEERNVLLGMCVQPQTKLTAHSPLLNEAFCTRPIDYRMLALGIIKYNPNELPLRLRHFLGVITDPEEEFGDRGIVLGIIGRPRKLYDTMLNPLPIVDERRNKSNLSQKSMSTTSSISAKKNLPTKLYSDIKLPKAEFNDQLPPTTFKDEPVVVRRHNEAQRQRWQNRLAKFNSTLSQHTTGSR